MGLQVTITHLSGHKTTQTEVFRKLPIWIGRGDTCQLRFDPERETQVSTLHAELTAGEDGGVVLSDLQSQNGTFLNDTKVAAPVPVTNNAVVQFGAGGPRVRIGLGEAGAVSFKKLREEDDAKEIVDRGRIASTERVTKPFPRGVPKKKELTPMQVLASPEAKPFLILALVVFAILAGVVMLAWT